MASLPPRIDPDSDLGGLILGLRREHWRAPPRLLISEWAGKYRYLSPEASAEAGLWNNARAPHLVAPMDALSPYHEAERVVCKFSSQSGKTEVILCFIGYIIDLDPGPVLAIQPNVTPMGEAFSKDRVATMLRDSPSLAEKIGKVRGRNSAQTLLHKAFGGGHLTIAGANSPAGLASRPIRYLVCDELDRWEVTKEGDPLTLARKRQTTFRARRNAKELVVSSPTYADIGISAEYERCDQQFEWHLGCLHCDAHQLPKLAHFRWEADNPSTVVYACEHCGGIHTLAQADKVKATGRWVQIKDGRSTSIGFYFNQWASPFARWDDTVAEWLSAKNDPARKQAVVNTAFAEPWEGEGEKAEPHALMQRMEDYGAEVPNEVSRLTMGVDVQGDRLEAEIVGWGPNRESWSIAYHVLPGEPTSKEVWDELRELIQTPCERADGTTLKIAVTCIDSGAYTQHVYEAISRYRDRSVIPIKGASGMTREEVDRDRRGFQKRQARRMRAGKPTEIIGVDQIKRTLFHALSAPLGSPGYCHFPQGRSEEYFLQLTGERLIVVSHHQRRPERRWVPVHAAVEALDARVYAMAGLLFSFITHGDDLERYDLPGPEGEKKNGRNGQNSRVGSASDSGPRIKRRQSGWLGKGRLIR